MSEQLEHESGQGSLRAEEIAALTSQIVTTDPIASRVLDKMHAFTEELFDDPDEIPEIDSDGRMSWVDIDRFIEDFLQHTYVLSFADCINWDELLKQYANDVLNEAYNQKQQMRRN